MVGWSSRSFGVAGTLFGRTRAPPPTTRLVGVVGTNFLGTDTEGSVMGPSFIVALDGSVAAAPANSSERSAEKLIKPKRTKLVL